MSAILIGLATTFVILGIVTAAEAIAPAEKFDLRSRWRGAVITVVGAIAAGFVMQAMGALWALLGVRKFEFVSLPAIFGDVLSVIIALMMFDFLGYWHHRLQHRYFWAIHAVHHSQTHLHAFNAYGHFLEKVTYYLVLIVPFSLFNFDLPYVPYVVFLMLRVLEAYIHAPTTAHLGPLRYLFVDNRFHRIHHSTEPQHFDKNFGICLSIWDRIFATAHEPRPDEWPATGVAGHPPPSNPLQYALFPLRFIKRRRNKRQIVAVK